MQNFDIGAIGAKRLGIFLSWTLCAVTLLLLNQISVPWVDEVGTSDTAVNIVLNGQWISHCWTYSYNLLHLGLLTIWLKIFGVSHFTVCAMNVILAGVVCQLLITLAFRYQWASRFLPVAAFCFLFWGGFRFSEIITNGRIDILALLCTVMLVSECVRDDCRFGRIVMWAFLCMAAAVYQIPVVLTFVLLFKVINGGGVKSGLQIKKSVLLLVGVFAAFVTACFIYATQHQVLRFIHTYFSFNATLSGTKAPLSFRLGLAYFYDWSYIGICFVGLCIAIVTRQFVRLKWYFCFILVIPLLQVLSGRWTDYYSWVSYVPATLLLLSIIGNMQCRFCNVVILSGSIMLACATMLCRVHSLRESCERVQKYEQLSKDAAPLMTGTNVVITSNLAYYGALGTARYVWKYGTTETLSPKEKFTKFVDKVVKDRELQRKLIGLYDKIQWDQPARPSGCVDVLTDKVFIKSHPVLNRNVRQSMDDLLLIECTIDKELPMSHVEEDDAAVSLQSAVAG